MMSTSLALISCNAAFREGREGEEGKDNGTHSRKAWEEKRERMVQSSM